MKFVKSKYASPWRGVILNEWKRHKSGNLCLVLVTNDRNGNRPNKRMLKTMDIGWLEIIPEFDLSHVPMEWYVFDPTIDITTCEGWNFYQK